MKYYDKKHISQIYKMRDLVMILIKNLQLKKSSWKLSHKFIEPFEVKDLVEKQIYRLFLSDTYWIHNIFYVFYLKPYQCCWEDEFISSLQSSELINDKEEYKIEKILDKWKHKKKIWYKIKHSMRTKNTDRKHKYYRHSFLIFLNEVLQILLRSY